MGQNMSHAKKAYREAAVRGASPVGLVIMLYEQAIQDLQRAMVAIHDKDIERRTREIDHAMRVLGQLQGTLDKERGGEVARNLQRFYELACNSLLIAQIQISPEIVRKQIVDLLELHEAWIQVERNLNPSQAAETSPTVVVEESTRGSWRG
jgi:flagellar protein FliS